MSINRAIIELWTQPFTQNSAHLNYQRYTNGNELQPVVNHEA
ncbi:hypothetical protein RCH20_001350 [Psychrobacter sp. PL15]|nr:hypothetical protein [Psychrobacter sp. PL15]